MLRTATADLGFPIRARLVATSQSMDREKKNTVYIKHYHSTDCEQNWWCLVGHIFSALFLIMIHFLTLSISLQFLFFMRHDILR